MGSRLIATVFFFGGKVSDRLNDKTVTSEVKISLILKTSTDLHWNKENFTMTRGI